MKINNINAKKLNQVIAKYGVVGSCKLFNCSSP